MKPTRAGLKFMGVAAQALLRTISRVAGADIVHDAVAFFQAFEGMEEGFRTRAARVGSCWSRRTPPSSWWRRPGPTRSTRPSTSPASWPSRTWRSPPWWSTGSSPGSPTTPSWRRCRPSVAAGHRRREPSRPLEQLVDNLRGYTDCLGPRGAGLRRPGVEGVPGPGVPGAPPEHRRPRPRRAGDHRRPPVHRAGGGRHDRARGRASGALTWSGCVPSSWPATLRRSEPRWRPSPGGPTSPSGRPGPGRR